MNYTLGIDIGSTTVKIAILNEAHHILFSDYKRHFANIQETLSELLKDSLSQLGNITLHPMITGSGGLTLANQHGSVNDPQPFHLDRDDKHKQNLHFRKGCRICQEYGHIDVVGTEGAKIYMDSVAQGIDSLRSQR